MENSVVESRRLEPPESGGQCDGRGRWKRGEEVNEKIVVSGGLSVHQPIQWIGTTTRSKRTSFQAFLIMKNQKSKCKNTW